MSESHSNSGFVPDEQEKHLEENIKNPTVQSSKDFHSIDLKELSKEKEASDQYEPYSNRKVEHPTTNSETLFHLLKGSLGTGILAMPKAFYHAGYLLGFVATGIIGAIATYCIHLLIKAQYELCKRKKQPSMTYPETAKAAFEEGPPPFRAVTAQIGHLVNIFLIIYQLGTCCVYIVFVSTNIKSVVDIYIDPLPLEIYSAALLLPLILINWIRNLKLLAPFSTAANAITAISFSIIFYYIIHDGPTFEEREAVGEVRDYPLFFGTVLFALEAIGVIMPLENEMKTPKSFGGSFGILNIGMILIVALYMIMGFLGYLTYGSLTEGTVTLNIPPGDIMAQIVKVTLAIAIFVTYALQCYVAIDITWNMYIGPKIKKGNKKIIWEYVVRTVLVIITFSLAVSVPKLDLFISLFGALCLAALGIAIPAIIDMSTFWYQKDGLKFKISFVKNVALIAFGLIGLVVGTYTSLHDIVVEFGE